MGAVAFWPRRSGKRARKAAFAYWTKYVRQLRSASRSKWGGGKS